MLLKVYPPLVFGEEIGEMAVFHSTCWDIAGLVSQLMYCDTEEKGNVPDQKALNEHRTTQNRIQYSG